jgi:branched-chain amino acid transport system permease protein
MSDQTPQTTGDNIPFDDSMSSEFLRAAAAPKMVHSIPFGDAFKALPTAIKGAIVAPLLVLLVALPWLSVLNKSWISGIPFIPTTGGNFPAILTALVVPFVLITLGLNVVVGQAGLLDLGYVGFFAIGAYTMGVLTSQHAKWDGILWLAALIIAVAVAMLAGVILGAPTLRLRGDYLAIVTLGFGEIIRIIAKNTAWLGASEGISNIKSMPSFLWFKIDVLESRWLWVIGLAVIGLVMFLLRRLEFSRVGRAWSAIREDEDAAELMGVPTFSFKLWAFAIGAAVGGLGGVFYTTRTSAIYERSFTIQQSILFLAAVVLGGLGNRWGAVLGGFLVAWGPEKLRDIAPNFLKEKYDFFEKIDLLRFFLFGLVLLFMMIFRPQGLLPRKVKARRAAGESGVGAANSAGLVSEALGNAKIAAAGLFVPFVGLFALLKGNALRKKAALGNEPEPGHNVIARRIGLVGLILSLTFAWMVIRPRFNPLVEGDSCKTSEVGSIKDELKCQVDEEGKSIWSFDAGDGSGEEEVTEEEVTEEEATVDTTVADSSVDTVGGES